MTAMTLAEARACIARGLTQAKQLGVKVAIAVVGFRASTLDLEERFTKRMLFADNVATLGDYAFVFGRGGVPVVQGGRVVGAVGVSGAVPADGDHAIADAAAGHPIIPSSH